jgi:HEAT repeat protein
LLKIALAKALGGFACLETFAGQVFPAYREDDPTSLRRRIMKQPGPALQIGTVWLAWWCLISCWGTQLCPAQQAEKPLDREAVLQSIESLKSKNALERARAAERLAQAGKAALPAVPALCEAVDDSVPAVRVAAVRALAPLTGLDAQAESTIVQILDSQDRHLILVAVDALASGSKDGVVGDEVLKRLFKYVSDPTTPAGQLALQALQRCQVRNTKKTAELLAQHLGEKSSPTSALIVRLLGQVPAGGGVTAEALCRALRFSDIQTRRAAQEALLRLISEHQEIADWVRLNTNAEEQALRVAQLYAFYTSYSTRRDQQSLQTILEHCRDADAQVRSTAYYLMALADLDQEKKVKLLAEGLRDGDAQVRRNVARLAVAGRRLPWKIVASELRLRLRDLACAGYLIRIVADIDPQAALDELPFLLANLSQMQDDTARGIVGACALEFSNRSPLLRQRILELLGAQAAEDLVLLPAVLTEWTRLGVRIGDQEIRRRLMSLADSKERLLASRALWVLAQQKDPDLLAFFLGRLNSNDLEQLAPAIVGLGNLGPAAKEALPALQRFTKDSRIVIDPRGPTGLTTTPIGLLAREAIREIEGQKNQ